MGSYFFDSQLAKTEPLTYVTDKHESCKSFIKYMNIRLQKMFKYVGLPDTIPKEILEYYLMNNGSCYVTKVGENLYAFLGSFGGEPDVYYRPTKYVIANPALELNVTYDLQKDGVLMRNDALWLGLYPLMSRYGSLLAENILTLRTADIMLRVMAMISAPDDKTKTAAEEYLKDLENGKIGVIGENRFLDDGVKMQNPPSNNGSYLTQFIELHQYLLGSFYNEIGLNANYNMKRESIGEGESSLNEDSLEPLCEHMLRCRKEDIEKINNMFGTEITVEFDSSWRNNQKEISFKLEKLENEASQLVDENIGGDNICDEIPSEDTDEVIEEITDEVIEEITDDIVEKSTVDSEDDEEKDKGDDGEHIKD
jgi:hypothetical protein